MKVGDVVKATIVNIKAFGALVDVDGCAGMIYYKNIRPRAEFGNISAVLSIGQKIDCVIEDIKDNGFLNLTMKVHNQEPRRSRAQVIQDVKEDIKDMSDNDTNIRAIWKALT